MTETKHISKRLLSILLAVCMALAFIPLQTAVTAAAASSEEIILQEGVDSEGSGWKFTGSTLTLENADLYYSGSSSLFSFEGSYASIVLKGYNCIELGTTGASAFEFADHDLGIVESSGVLQIKGSGVYLAEKETSVTVDSGYILTPGIKAAGSAATTINGGYVEADNLTEAGARLLVNGGYVYAGASYGDVTVMGGFVHEWDAFMGGSLTFQNCVIQTLNIDFTCTVVQKANDSVLILEDDANNWSDKSPGILQGVIIINTSQNWVAYANEYYGSPKQISDGEHKGVFVDSGSKGSSEIGSGVTLTGGNYFFNKNADEPALIIKPGAKLADGINNSTIVGRNNNGSAIVLDGTDTTSTGDFKFGTLAGLGKDNGIKIEGSANLTGGRICGKAGNGSVGVDISIEDGGSISDTQLIGISQDGTGTQISSCPSADSSTSIIGFDRGDGIGLVKKNNDLLDCGMTSYGKYGLDTDITYNTTFEFNLNSKTTTPFGDILDYTKNCSGKGWAFYRNNFGEYDKYLPYQQPGMAVSLSPALLVLDNFSFSTLADEAVSIPAANYSIKDVYIVVKGNCSLTGAKYGLQFSADTSITIIGADEDSRLTINLTDSGSNGAGIYKVTPKSMTIKDLNLSINAGAGCGITSAESLGIYNSNITISQDTDSDYAIYTSSTGYGTIYFGGNNDFTFYGPGKVYSGSHQIYSCLFAEGSQAAADYNEKIQNGEAIEEMVFKDGEKVSSIGFDFNTDKYNVSDITSKIEDYQQVFYVTLTDKDPDSVKRYGGEPLEIDLNDFFVGGNGKLDSRKGSTYGPSFTGDSFDIDCSANVYTGTASNSDNTVTVGFRYENNVSYDNVNIITSLPDDRGFYILYQFDIEKQPEITADYNADGGEVTVSADKVRSGGDAEVVVTPNEGWVIGSVTLNGSKVELTDGKLSLKNITEDQKITVDFKRLYTVTVNVEGIDDGTSAVKPGTTVYVDGEDAVFEISEFEDLVASVTLDGELVELTDGKYTISSIDSDHTLSVKYSDKYEYFDLTIECGANGKSSFGDTTLITKVRAGTVYDIELIPDEGYRVKSVTVNGEEIKVTDNKASFALTADSVLRIEFEKLYALTIECGANGKTSLGDVTLIPDVAAGTVYNIELIPDEGYRVKSVTLNGEEIKVTDNKASFALTADSVLKVEFEKLPELYDLTVECGANGKTSLGDVTLIPDVAAGTVYNIELIPDSGYKVKSVMLNDVALTVTDNKVSFTLTADSVLKIEFEKKYSGGSISGGSSGGRVNTDYEINPSLNGSSKSWTDISSELDKMAPGSSVSISLVGNTTVPADVIRSIMNRKLKAEFTVDSVRSWIIDGAEISNADSVDLSVINRASDTSKLRGECAFDEKVNGSGVPSVLRLKADKKHAGKFANIYRISGGKPVYFGCFKIREDGTIDIDGAEAGGEYVVMIYPLSHQPGDINNDGIMNALDAAAVLKYVVGIGGADNPEMADMNGDGIINAMDAHEILKAIIRKN